MAPSSAFRSFFSRDYKDAAAFSLAVAEAINQEAKDEIGN
jgi:hypothetical protein